MDTFIDFVSRLIYATGGEAAITPNHNAWVQTHPTPTGAEWLAHHVDTMLPAFEGWLAAHFLPPIIPWDGTDPRPWEAGIEVPLPSSLDGSFTGVSNLEDLGQELRDRLDTVSAQASELGGDVKAPFSYRYWGYVKWASQMRERYNGAIVLPVGHLFDRDGTPLSAIPFTDVFNQLHFSWHNSGSPPTASGPTPGFDTSAGQLAGSGGVGMSGSEEFIQFHRDHTELFSRWLARTGQPPVRGRNMRNAGQGWPAAGAGNPSTWAEGDDDPLINEETGDTDGNLLAGGTDVGSLASLTLGVHGSGHNLNSDIASLTHNNYVPRFHAWHGWIDNQLWWREPRFASWNATTGLRERVFEPVLSTGADWPGLPALTIVRDPLAPSDAISPQNGVAGLNFSTGAGTLRMKFLVSDSYDRPIRLRLTAEVFDDATSTTVPVETIPDTSNTFTVGDSSAGDDFDLGTEFTVDFTFTSAFQSDDPGGANPAVGFVNSRIRITGLLDADDGSDPGFVHRDYFDIHLVQEKQAPEIDLYFDLSSFGEDQVVSAMAGGEARFSNALYVVVQDRTSQPAVPAWQPEVADEVKGLIQGWIPASGLFDDPAHAPEMELVDAVTNTPIAGLALEFASGPLLEDGSLPDNLPQRFTYRYDVVFQDPNDAFAGLPFGGQRFATVRATAADRSGNGATVQGQFKLFREANPFMRDGTTSWLSIDTRVFRLFEGESKFAATLNPGQPNAFIQQVIQNLNSGATGGDTFDGLPEKQSESALEYSTAITNPSTSSSQNIYNFALAKVRLQGAAGAADVRTFFRLFRYTSTNLIFDPTTGYRTDDDGVGKKIPLLGFSSAAPGGQVISIPFFAAQRVPAAQPMTGQTDAPNVQSFPAGPTAERVLYFGAYLDINQDGARLPADYIAAHPDGGFGAGEVQSIRSLMLDAHQCMVVEVAYDGDPTATGDTPASSDNLAQRNLQILLTDNPGGPLTHTVQHSFEVDLGKRRREDVQAPTVDFTGADTPSRTLRMLMRDHPDQPLAPAIRLPLRFINSEQHEERAKEIAQSLAINRATNMEEMMDAGRFLPEARRQVDQRHPLVFDAARWASTTRFFDEMLFVWNDLPAESIVEIYLPRTNCEAVVNLRNLRHAPGDVRIVDAHTLRLIPDGVTYLPLPPGPGGRVAGVITITLPEGIRKGQQWDVDVIQLRGPERRTTGGFQMHIEVSNAQAIADAERRLLEVMFERLALLDPKDPWHPVLVRRVETIRARAEALADSAGIEWVDPTQWIDPDTGAAQPFDGVKVRVVIERIQILDDREPWFKGKGEFRFRARVHTPTNGGTTQDAVLPPSGVYKASDAPGENVLALNAEVFSGYADDELWIEVVATEQDTFDPDDLLGKYTRMLSGPTGGWFRQYGPGDQIVEPEDMISWRIWYRVERG